MYDLFIVYLVTTTIKKVSLSQIVEFCIKMSLEIWKRLENLLKNM